MEIARSIRAPGIRFSHSQLATWPCLRQAIAMANPPFAAKSAKAEIMEIIEMACKLL
jgi:hypothetical protein